MIKIKTMILCICITLLLIVTFSVLIVSILLSNCDLTDIVSIHVLILIRMTDFDKVSDTLGMSICQKHWIKKQNVI